MQQLRGRTIVWIAGLLVCPLLPGCSGKSKGQSAKGICAPACPKPCSEDQECDMPKGELCCDFGEQGRACMAAKQCPRFCEGDQTCDTPKGEACLRVTLAAPSKVCVDPSYSLRLCANDQGCDTPKGEKCCDIYQESVCLPAAECPKACTQSGECDSRKSETCCTSVQLLEPTLKVTGLCLDSRKIPCPVLCTTSAECKTQDGELCCNGICSKSCAKECAESSECAGQLCCKTKAATSVWYGNMRKPGFPASGCDSDLECTGDNERCVSKSCKVTCDKVIACVKAQCATGCDPNKLCNLLDCPAAKAWAQCMATKCTTCFTAGFNSYDCQDCTSYYNYCSTEKSLCTAYGCTQGEKPVGTDGSVVTKSDGGVKYDSGSLCLQACQKLNSCLGISGECKTMCSNSEETCTASCIMGATCTEIEDYSQGTQNSLYYCIQSCSV